MRRPPRHRPSIVSAVLLIVAIAPELLAQRSRSVTQAGTVRPYTVPAPDDGKRAMTVAEIAKWRTIRDVAISDDGLWASYGYQQRRTDDTLFLKNLETGAEQRVPRASRSCATSRPARSRAGTTSRHLHSQKDRMR